MDDGIRLCLDDEGEGEALILAHGLNSNRSNNMDFYDEFRDEYRVITYDQRGHGDSDKSTVHMNIKRLGRDLKCIIESLGLNDVTVIGHSMVPPQSTVMLINSDAKTLKELLPLTCPHT